MPQGEKFWNPYRWVRVSDQPVERAAPNYHHQFSGLSGRVWCELEALTPLLIGDGQGNFVRRKTDNKPYIPATSLKGAIRSLVELIGNSAVPFDKCNVDNPHKAGEAAAGSGPNWRLDIVARTFGYLDGSNAFSGLVHFSDALRVDETLSQEAVTLFRVAGGQPDPNHRPFYPDNRRRKLYHHQPDATELTPPHAGIREDQKRSVRPLPPETTFRFNVDFFNLRNDEVNLLLYSLVLEAEVTVTLSRASLGPDARADVTFTGPLRHKLGGCKPQGAGSSHIRVTKLLLRGDPAARYRGQSAETEFAEEDLTAELRKRTSTFCGRFDDTMQQLRAMLIYSADDPRKTMNYPDYQWFQTQKNTGAGTPLKPTL
jgi:hypothetical protein